MKYFNKAVFIALTLFVSHKTHANDLALYEALGKEAGITKIVSHALDLSFEDPRTKTQFAHSKKDRLVKLISEQICELVGGPCEYKGLNMIKAHIKLGITEREFNALVEQLQTAMEAENISYRMQNKLLALLAPMKSEIVER